MGLIPVLLAFGALPALATPVYYTINFTSGSPLPTSGSFFYDSATSTFASFDVMWDGDTFDLTAGANAQPFSSPTDPCFSGSTTGAQEVFLLMTACSSDANPLYSSGPPVWQANNNVGGYTSFDFDTADETGPNHIGVVFQYFTGDGTTINDANGGFESTAPEPDSCALTLIGLCVVTRKRIATGFRRLHRE
jgi:hypothetical protein